MLTAYVAHIRGSKTAKSPQADIYYLRDAFGPVCDAVKVTSRTLSVKAKKRPPKPGQDRRRKPQVIEAACFEQISTAQVATFISGQVASRGLAPKTANRYREILTRLFNWSMTQHGVKMPNDKNPAAAVDRYKEHAPEIRFLTLAQVNEQLTALADDLQMQAMVATLIYAGLPQPSSAHSIAQIDVHGADSDQAACQLVQWRGPRLFVPNPLKACRLPQPPATPQFTPTLEQVQTILDKAQGQRKLQYAMLAMTGLRAQEMQMLRPRDVDLTKGWIHVVGHDGWTPKTGVIRKIPIHPKLVEMLAAVSKAARPYFFCAAPSPKYPAGGHMINIKQVNEDLQQLAKSLGIETGRKNVGLVVHSLRHFFETQCVDSGVPQFQIDAWMGHSSHSAMGRRYYGQTDAKSLEQIKRVQF